MKIEHEKTPYSFDRYEMFLLDTALELTMNCTGSSDCSHPNELYRYYCFLQFRLDTWNKGITDRFDNAVKELCESAIELYEKRVREGRYNDYDRPILI